MKSKVETIYQGEALNLGLEQVQFPDGTEGTLEIIRHPGGAGAVALDESGRVCLIHQYRYAADGWLWEVPAGRLEQDEDPLNTAKRELAEEAGLCATQWQSLNTIYPSPGICDERISLYLARKLSPVDIAHEAQEFIERHWVPLPEAIDWIAQGTITDAKTIVALYAAWAYLGNETPAITQS